MKLPSAPDRRPRHCSHEPKSAPRSARRAVPTRPLLPSRGVPDSRPTAARAIHRHSATRGAFPLPLREARRTARRAVDRGVPPPASIIRLAGKCARTRKRNRASPRHLRTRQQAFSRAVLHTPPRSTRTRTRGRPARRIATRDARARRSLADPPRTRGQQRPPRHNRAPARNHPGRSVQKNETARDHVRLGLQIERAPCLLCLPEHQAKRGAATGRNGSLAAVRSSTTSTVLAAPKCSVCRSAN